eukprot:5498663-Lingulodinium_polyedra.AAC.1
MSAFLLGRATQWQTQREAAMKHMLVHSLVGNIPEAVAQPVRKCFADFGVLLGGERMVCMKNTADPV